MKFIISKRHCSKYPNPIMFERGEVVELGELDNENLGWRRVRTDNGNEGWAPVAYFDKAETEGFAIANQSYSARELNVNPGEVVEVLREISGWYWCEGESKELGWLPSGIGNFA